jgi:hypothetical protein
MKQQPKTCAFCGEEFTPERRNGIYCSNTCRQYSYLQRKTGEPYDFPEEQEDEDPVIPALIIEEESDADILSNQHQQKSSIHSFLETEPVKQTPAAMKSEETIRHQLPSNSALPLVLLENEGFVMTDTNSYQGQESDPFLPRKNYPDILDDETQRIRQELDFLWELTNPDKKQKLLMMQFGEKLKPYLEALLSMNEKQIKVNTLMRLQKEMANLALLYLPNACPSLYPPVRFFMHYLKDGLKQFLKEQNNPVQFEFRLSDEIKARIDLLLMIIDELEISTEKIYV